MDPTSGGPIEGLTRRLPLLKQLGHEVEIVSLDLPGKDYLDAVVVPVHPLGQSTDTYGYSDKLTPWVRENAHRFDRVVINGLWQYNSVGVEAGLRNSGVPYYVFTHGMLDPWFRRQYPLKHLKKQIFWLMHMHRVLRRAKAVLFTCEEEMLQARNAFVPYVIKERVVKYGTVRPEKSKEHYLNAFAAEFPELSQKRFLLFLSRIHEKKGIDLLIDAYCEKYSEWPFDLAIAGPDPHGLGKHLEEKVQSRGLKGRIAWLGMLGGDTKLGAFCTAEASILPSHQENFGITVAEALSCSTPVLISNKVNIWREILNAGAGLVEDDTLRGTRKLLELWQATSPEIRSAMGESALRCFNENFEIRQSVESFLEALA